jgi:hypothetical protein
MYKFDEEVYAKKVQFIMRCRHISECKNCNNYNKNTGCKDPEYPKGKLLKYVPERKVENVSKD